MGSFRKVLVLVVFAGLILGGQADAMKRYDSRSGYIKYEGSTGTEELYWDNYGEREARYRNTSVTVFGMTQTDNSIDIIDGDWVYSVQPDKGIATKVNYADMMKQMTGSNAQQPREFSEAMIKQWGGEKIGTEKILGKNTEIYKFNMMGDYRVWLYKKTIPLKMEMKSAMFSMSNVATEFKENARVDAAKFKLPTNVKIVEQDVGKMPTAEEMQDYRKAMETMQNDPEFQESMQQMQEFSNSPEFQDAMKQLQGMKDNPEFQDAMKQMQQMQVEGKGNFADSLREAVSEANRQGGNYNANEISNAGNSVVSDSIDIIRDETSTAVTDGVRQKTQELFGTAAGSATGTAGSTGSVVTDSVDIIKDEAATAVKDGVRTKTKELLGGGLKKFLN